MIYTSKHTIFIAWLCTTLLWACNNVPITNNNTVALQDTTTVSQNTIEELSIIDYLDYSRQQWRGDKYDSSFLFDLKSYKNDNETKSLLLGITSARWMYKKNYQQDNTAELTLIKQLATELQINQYFEIQPTQYKSLADTLCLLYGFNSDLYLDTLSTPDDTIFSNIQIGMMSLIRNIPEKNNLSLLIEWGYAFEYLFLCSKTTVEPDNIKFLYHDFSWTHKVFYKLAIVRNIPSFLKKHIDTIDATFTDAIKVVDMRNELKIDTLPNGTIVFTHHCEIPVLGASQTKIDSMTTLITNIRNELHDEVMKTDTRQ